jgi:hypothetical protein
MAQSAILIEGPETKKARVAFIGVIVESCG